MKKKCSYNFLKIGSWNIQGVYQKINGLKINKLEDPEFLTILNSHDILCVQETHCGQNDTPTDHISDFCSIPHCRKKSSNNRYFGGMLLLIRKNIRKGVKICFDKDPEILGINLSKTFFGLDEDIQTWFTYAPPLNSPYTKNRNVDVLDLIETLIDPDNSNILLGDLNGRTNTSPDQIEDGHDDHSPINDIGMYTRFQPLQTRNNMDTALVDQQGKHIINKCKSLNLRILNGRTKGDRAGAFTRFPFHREENPSVIDYGLCNHATYSRILSFIVQPYEGLSDHCCISISLEAAFSEETDTPTVPKANQPEKPPPFIRELANQYRDNLDKDDRLLPLLNSLTTTTTEVSQEDVDKWANTFNQIISSTASKTFGAKKTRNPPTPPRKPKAKTPGKPAKWFNEQCKATKARLKILTKAVQKKPLDRHIRENLVGARKAYKTACRKAESSFRKRMLKSLLEENDPKKFWEMINKMKNWSENKPDPSNSIPPDQWKKHFTDLLNTDDQEKFTVPDNIPPHELDRHVTQKELENALNRAKDGKAFGPDLTIMEYIKYSSDSTKKTLLTLINIIFIHATYPTLWTTNFLKAIFKKGAKTDPNNYRGLAIGPALGKLYSLILLERLETYCEDNKIISKFQIAFRKAFRTADHVYVLKTLVTKLVTQGNHRLFAAFIDFKKAYDTVNRTTLLKTLHNIGIGKTMLHNIQALYKTTNYTIKTRDGLLETIPSNLGLKQGCPLSPLLFNLYINNFASYLTDLGENNIMLGKEKISHFFYADDLVILAESKEKLQTKLDQLAKFAKDKDLTVNADKSKVMIFNRAGRRIIQPFTINGEDIEVVQSFTYLGVDITASGSFSPAIKELCSKAKKAMMPLFRAVMQFQMPFKLALKLFHTYIEPILLYNAENWTIFTDKQLEKCRASLSAHYKNAINAPQTTVQLKYYKFILGLKRQTPNLAVFGEIARLPLALKAHLTMLKFWNRIRHMDRDTLVNQAYWENVIMNSNWCRTIQHLNVTHNLHDRRNHNSKKFPEMAKKTITKDFITHWRTSILDQDTEKKLGFYSKYKESFTQHQYLNMPDFHDRQRITKLLCSDHSLEIETGRHRLIRKPREERTCTMCDLNQVEDEKHFLLDCPAYLDLRASCALRSTSMTTPNLTNLLT